MNTILAAWLVVIGLTSCRQIGSFQLQPEFTIYVNDPTSEPIAQAVKILQRDIRGVLGKEAKVISEISSPEKLNKSLIIILGGDPDLGIETLEGFERHKIFTLNDNMVVQGSDIRGTIYAIYTFSENFLGINPLWYWTHNKPLPKESIRIPNDYTYDSGVPYVTYRSWCLNNSGIRSPWKKENEDHQQMWLETILRLKLNCVQINSSINYSKKLAITPQTQLIDAYGLKIAFHPGSAVNSPYAHWDEYWTRIRKMEPPELLLSNVSRLEEFWRYNIKCLENNRIDPIWAVDFTGSGDLPFWRMFSDSPDNLQSRAKVFNEMIERQVKIIKEETKKKDPLIRVCFNDQLSEWMAEGLWHPPNKKELIWNITATPWDLFPNAENRNFPYTDSVKLGCHLNYQSASKGIHFAPAIGPWKMEEYYSYLDSKNSMPLYCSIAYAGNLRGQLLTLSANAEILWHFQSYDTDEYVKSFCSTYYGDDHMECISKLYKEYFYAYWKPEKSDLERSEQEYIFDDLIYQQAINQLFARFIDPMDHPPKAHSLEQQPGKFYIILPENSDGRIQMHAFLQGINESYHRFKKVALDADSVNRILSPGCRTLLSENLINSAHFMMFLNETLYHYGQAFISGSEYQREEYLRTSLNAAMNARESFFKSVHDQDGPWYMEERFFAMDDLVSRIDKTLNHYQSDN